MHYKEQRDPIFEFVGVLFEMSMTTVLIHRKTFVREVWAQPPGAWRVFSFCA
jgi:hypothetical protein